MTVDDTQNGDVADEEQATNQAAAPSEIDARIAECNEQLARLHASKNRGRHAQEPSSTSLVQSSVVRRLLQAGRAVLRSPGSLLTDLERYLSWNRHRPERWKRSARRPVSVSDRLQDVWPLNVEIRRHAVPTLNVLLPSLRRQDLTGGPNTVLNLTYRLAAQGVPVRYVATDKKLEENGEFLWEQFQALTGIGTRLANVQIVSGRDRNRPLPIGEEDVMCGTAWWTVQMIKEILPRLKSNRFLYMIQDYEPGMYAWSTKQALASETYGMDFRGIVCGRLLADFLATERIGRFAEAGFMESCAVFEPAVDPERFCPRFETISTRKKRLLFYARPQTPRNLFELGLVALKRAVDRGAFPADTWELGFIGGNLPPADLAGEVTIHPHPWRDYNDYARLLRETDVGLSLMLSPHTSYPPLEMAACGATVVTNTFSVKTANRLRRISENILPVQPRLEDITDGLVTAAARAENLPDRFAGSMLDVPSDWNMAIAPLLPKLLEMWDDCRSGQSKNHLAPIRGE